MRAGERHPGLFRVAGNPTGEMKKPRRVDGAFDLALAVRSVFVAPAAVAGAGHQQEQALVVRQLVVLRQRLGGSHLCICQRRGLDSLECPVWGYIVLGYRIYPQIYPQIGLDSGGTCWTIMDSGGR